MKAAIYVRVSTEEQRERQSIATQREFGERFCALHEIPISGFYADDGISGTVPIEGRQEGKRLLEDARSRKFEQVLVYKLDRLGREPRLILNAVKELEDLGVVVRSMTEPFETSTPAGRFLLTILSGVAGLERDNIVQRSTEGINRLVRAGAWVGGVAPYGYRVTGKRKESRLVISDEPVPGTGLTESGVIRLIFQMAGDEGRSCLAIADHLNQLGIPTTQPARLDSESERGRRTKTTAGIWRDSRLQYMLRSPTYKGIHRYGRRPKNKRRAPAIVERQVPPIVDPELWERAQLTLVRNRLYCSRNAQHQYLLRGLARCAHCGWTYIGTVYSGSRRPTHRSYVCGGRHKGRKVSPDPAKRCHAMAIPGDIEDVIWAQVEGFLRNPQRVMQQLMGQFEQNAERTASVKSRLSTLRAALEAKDGERTRVVSLFRRGRIDDDALDVQLGEIDHERAGLLDEIQRLETATDLAKAVEAQILSAATMLETLGRALEGPLTWEVKREIIEQLVAKITVETVGEGADRASVVRASYYFGVPGDTIAPCSPRGISALQALALPLGYAASHGAETLPSRAQRQQQGRRSRAVPHPIERAPESPPTPTRSATARRFQRHSLRRPRSKTHSASPDFSLALLQRTALPSGLYRQTMFTCENPATFWHRCTCACIRRGGGIRTNSFSTPLFLIDESLPGVSSSVASDRRWGELFGFDDTKL